MMPVGSPTLHLQSTEALHARALGAERRGDTDLLAYIESLIAARERRAADRSKPKMPKIVRLPNLYSHWQPIIDEACRRHGVCRRDLLSGWRTPRAAMCRFDIWHTIHAFHGTSMTRIGKRFGGYHHTSVRHGILTWQAHLDAQEPQKQAA